MLSRFELLNNAVAARPLKPLGQSIILKLIGRRPPIPHFAFVRTCQERFPNCLG